MFPKIFTDPARLLRGRTISILGAALLWALPGAGPAVAGEYDLTVETAHVEIGGRMVEKMTINGGVPGPTLRLREGEDATITVTNKTDEATSVHWHGILLPGIMDGAPGFNGFMGIAPGASYTYTFPIRQSGTYWYHSHSGTQDQTVLGAIVIEPAKPTPFSADRDYVVLLGDATPEDSDRVLRNLKADPGYYNYSKRTLLDFFADVGREGVGATVQDRLDWGAMRMDPTDLADVTGYSFLVNGKAPERNETFLFRKGERIRLRLINGAAMTLFDVRIPGLKMTVVAADGNDVNPVPVDELRIGVAERYDVIVEPKEDMPYTLFAESIDAGQRARRSRLEGGAGHPRARPWVLLSSGDMGVPMSDTISAAWMMVLWIMPQRQGRGSQPRIWRRIQRPSGRLPRGFGGARVLAYDDPRAALPHRQRRTVAHHQTPDRQHGTLCLTLDDRRFREAAPIRCAMASVPADLRQRDVMAHPMHCTACSSSLKPAARTPPAEGRSSCRRAGLGRADRAKVGACRCTAICSSHTSA